MNRFRNPLLALIALPLAACVFRMPIQQGNYIDPAAIAQVKPGMTRTQVRFLLGTPMVPTAFDPGRWDYDYYLKTKRLQSPKRGHATVYFRDELVDHVETDVTGTLPTAVSKRGASAPEPR